jgi:hypothetical protein
MASGEHEPQSAGAAKVCGELTSEPAPAMPKLPRAKPKTSDATTTAATVLRLTAVPPGS